MISENCTNVSCDSSLNASHGSSEARLIPVGQGMFAVVDAVDYPYLKQFKWHLLRGSRNRRPYPYRYLRSGEQGYKDWRHRVPMSMAEEVHGKKPGYQIDHRNRNPLDCRIENLRWATVSQQNGNRISWNTLGLKGTQMRKSGRYRARIWMNGTNVSLGTFATATEAAAAYNEAAMAKFGEFACLNPID